LKRRGGRKSVFNKPLQAQSPQRREKRRKFREEEEGKRYEQNDREIGAE
jgi:hypothetical protein